MTNWHWVRHGPTHSKTFVGWRDVAADLSDHAQIARLKSQLPDEAILISSDLERARETATAIGGAGHQRLPHDPQLREIHFGDWDGLPFETISEKDPKRSREFWETPGDVAAPGGESWNMASDRVQSAVSRISAQNAGKHIIAVAHFGTILTQLQRALEVDAYSVLAHSIDNFSVTTIEWVNRGPALVSRINHLP